VNAGSFGVASWILTFAEKAQEPFKEEILLLKEEILLRVLGVPSARERSIQ
jgi:hypothetical protein